MAATQERFCRLRGARQDAGGALFGVSGEHQALAESDRSLSGDSPIRWDAGLR